LRLGDSLGHGFRCVFARPKSDNQAGLYEAVKDLPDGNAVHFAALNPAGLRAAVAAWVRDQQRRPNNGWLADVEALPRVVRRGPPPPPQPDPEDVTAA
jgi:hypothetical protein